MSRTFPLRVVHVYDEGTAQDFEAESPEIRLGQLRKQRHATMGPSLRD